MMKREDDEESNAIMHPLCYALYKQPY